MLGLTKMMYDMTTKVVIPAKVSRERVVPRREKAKKRSNRLIEPIVPGASAVS
jgi:hypothetical protein